MKRIILGLFLLSMVGCTDAQISGLKSYGEQSTIYCYSGGKEVFRTTSTGKVLSLEGGGWAFRSQDNKFIKTFADCFVEVKE